MTTTNVLITGDSFAANGTLLGQIYAQTGDAEHSIQFQGSQIADSVYAHEGYPGITSHGLNLKMATITAAYPSVDIYVPIVGKNDVLIGFSPDVTLQGIRSIITAINQAQPTAKIVLPYLPPVGFPTEQDAVMAINRGLREARLMPNVYPVLMRSTTTAQLAAELSSDGVHLTGTGYSILAGAIAEAIRPIRH